MGGASSEQIVATIDSLGKTFTGGATYGEQNKIFGIISNIGQSVLISILVSDAKKGTTNFNLNNLATYGLGINANNFYSTNNSDATGSITISNLDVINKVDTGTFNFDAKNLFTDEIIKVTNDSFTNLKIE